MDSDEATAAAGRPTAASRRRPGVPRVVILLALLALAAGLLFASAAHLPAETLLPVNPWPIALLIVGTFAGALAGMLLQERGYGLASDILVGVIGASLGGFLQPPGFLSDRLYVDHALLTASIVACVLIALKIALVHALGRTRPRPAEQPPGVSRSPAPTAQSWWHRHPYLVSFVLGLVPAALWVAVVAAGLYADVHEHQYLIAYIPLQLLFSPAAILYPLVVLAALASLVVPYLRRRYAGGLWTAALLNPIVMLVVWWAPFMLGLYGGD